MHLMTAREFWPKYRDEVRRRCTAEAMQGNWHRLGIEAAKAVCVPLESSEKELQLDVLGYERRTPRIWYDSDLRVAFEHEFAHPYPYCDDDGTGWRCELWKLAHIVADLRVLSSYYKCWDGFTDQLGSEVASMGDRMLRVPKSEWLFIFRPYNSARERQPWQAWTIDDKLELHRLDDDDPFCPAEHCGR